MNKDTNSFPYSGLYTQRLRPIAPSVRESCDGRVFHYSERHLHCVWADPAYRPKTFRSADGEEVSVIDPGRWNMEAGPDFTDATLSIGPGSRHIKGDVEVHVNPNDWIKHSHSKDPRYKRIIAHVTYFDGTLPAENLPGGAVQISLHDALKTNPMFCFDNIDITAYPYSTITSPPPCRQILSSWSGDEKISLIEAEGEHRLMTKASRMAAAIKEYGKEQVLYEEIMCALGYKHNKAAFRNLARRVPWNSLRSISDGNASKSYTLLLGVSGLLPSRMLSKWDSETKSFVRHLWDNWWKMQTSVEHLLMDKTSWRIAGLRPQNHPLRRLAAAAALFGSDFNIHSRLLSLDLSSKKNCFKAINSLFHEACRMKYWDCRLSFSGKIQPEPVCLLGEHRIAAIISNVIVPYLAASGIDPGNLLSDLPEEDDNSLSRQAAFTILGRDYNPSLYKPGLRQQGLLRIFQDFCLANKECETCEFARSLKEHSRQAAQTETMREAKL